MMQASYFRRFGGPEVLEYGELPDPAPRAGEVLVEIHAASVNAADWKMRAGNYGAAVDFPHVPGRDFSGVIVSGGGFFKPGDAVFGVCEVPREGAYAEKIAIREAIVAKKPERLSHVQRRRSRSPASPRSSRWRTRSSCNAARPSSSRAARAASRASRSPWQSTWARM
jgi:NADPH:quinone reductase-like Zn-dependent oxidoreductase